MFKCFCGATFESYKYNVFSGHTKSCGCLGRLRSENASFKNPAYRVWQQMRSRCSNPRATGFDKYGGRGIAVCVEWGSFERFLADMGPRPSRDHTLDRIDNNEGYSKENCRWATRNEQANNTRRNHFIEFDGQALTVAQWAERVGVKQNTLLYRLRRGWPVNEALFGREQCQTRAKI